MDKDDELAVIACADLVGRTGAKEFKVGYLHEGVPASQAGWYAYARYRGSRITVGDQPSPAAACSGLAERLLTGGKCQHCKRAVTTNPAGLLARDSTLVGGEEWTAEQQAAAGLCVWQRRADRWVRGCAEGGG